MRVLISADMEGITGVTCPADVTAGDPRWEVARHHLMRDVNAATEGFFLAGATEVTVNDAHSTKRNLILDELDERSSAIIGKHKPLGMMQGVDAADAVAFIGYHTGAGRQGVLSHTYIGKTVLEVTVNGEPADEGRINSLLAAEFGLPVVLVTGDDLTCESAASWAPAAETVAVKTCVDRYTARCLPPERTETMIREAAARALGKSASVERPEGPFTFEVTFDAAQAVAACAVIPGVERTGERAVGFAWPTMLEAVGCFKVVTVLAGGSAEPVYD
jgi:D-amino peptidase